MGEKLEATVVTYTSKWSRGRDGGTTYAPVVQFRYNEKILRRTSSASSSYKGFKIGEKIYIYYNPSYPKKIVIATVFRMFGFTSIFSAIGLALMIFSGWAAHWDSQINRVLNNWTGVSAKIISIFGETSANTRNLTEKQWKRVPPLPAQQDEKSSPNQQTQRSRGWPVIIFGLVILGVTVGNPSAWSLFEHFSRNWIVGLLAILGAYIGFASLFQGIGDLIITEGNENDPTLKKQYKIKLQWQPPGSRKAVYNQIYIRAKQIDFEFQEGDTIDVFIDPKNRGKVVLDPDRIPFQLSKLA